MFDTAKSQLQESTDTEGANGRGIALRLVKGKNVLLRTETRMAEGLTSARWGTSDVSKSLICPEHTRNTSNIKNEQVTEFVF